MRTPKLLLPLVLCLTACGGLVDDESSRGNDAVLTKREPVTAHTASGLWISRAPIDEARFNVLDLCKDGTIAHDLPGGTLDVMPKCPSPTGIYDVNGDAVVIGEGSSRRHATLAGDTLLMTDAAQTYFRATPATSLDGVYAMHDVIGDPGQPPVTLTRQVRFANGRYQIANVLEAGQRGDRWSTEEEGTFAISSPGLVDLSSSTVIHRLHVVAFGPHDADFLHVENVGYLTRVPQ